MWWSRLRRDRREAERKEADAREPARPLAVLDWHAFPADGRAFRLRILCAQTQEEAKAGGRSVELELTLQQALDLSVTLARQANRTLWRESKPEE